MGSAPKRLSSDEIAKILSMYESCEPVYTIKEICAAVNVSPTSLNGVAKRHFAKRGQAKTADSLECRAYKLWLSGMQKSQITATLGISNESLDYILAG